MRSTWNFFSGQQLIYGQGSAAGVCGIASRIGARRVLVVTDPVVQSFGLLDSTLEALGSAGADVEVFAEGVVEPSTETAADAATIAKGFDPELVVAVGGGSNMDLAKLTAVVHSHGGVPADYLGVDKVPGPIVPLLCLPTTAGTGSEVSHSAVVRQGRDGEKSSLLSPYIRPAFAVIDPTLTVSCPLKLTAESGIDALTHAIEAYLATSYDQFDESAGAFLAYEGNHELGDIFAEKSIRLIGENLETVCQEPSDLPGRGGMALAATLAGVAFSHGGVTLAHALEYPIGAACHCAHGVGNGVLLPEVMRYLAPVRRQKLARIAQLLGVFVAGMEEDDAVTAAIAEVERLRAAIRLPSRLREVGARREDLPKFAAKAITLERLIGLSARSPDESDLLEILEASF